MFVRSRRMAGVWAGAALALALTTGCVPESVPSPSPTQTGFASEEEAFAAAEETYRAYVDALNQVDLSDPKTFEPVYALTTGELLEQEKKQLSQYHAEGAQVRGDSSLTVAVLRSWDDSADVVVIAACVDVSEVDVLDIDGKSLVSAERPDVQSTLATMVPGDSSTGLHIDSIEGREGAPECGVS